MDLIDQERHRVFKFIVIMLLLSFLIAASSFPGLIAKPIYQDEVADQLRPKFLRLHVIAHSDLPEDQALKYLVRDEIIKNLDEEFKDVTDIELSKQFVRDHLKDLENMAQAKIRSQGSQAPVRAVFGSFPFPAKTYGHITLPGGEYEALRIVIGDGQGANWWCVLFPPLCFVDIARGDPQEEMQLCLQGSFTPEELVAIKAQPKTPPIEIKYKVVELWQEAQGKLQNKLKLARQR